MAWVAVLRAFRMFCAEAFSATMMPDNSEIAIPTAVSHRQPNCFLTLFPLFILGSALTSLFVLNCRTRRWAAASTYQWSCHRPNRHFSACFRKFSKKRKIRHGQSAGSGNQNDRVGHAGPRPPFKGASLQALRLVGLLWKFSGEAGPFQVYLIIPKRRIGLEQRRRRGKSPGRVFIFWGEERSYRRPSAISIDPLITFSLSSRRATCDLLRANARD